MKCELDRMIIVTYEFCLVQHFSVPYAEPLLTITFHTVNGSHASVLMGKTQFLIFGIYEISELKITFCRFIQNSNSINFSRSSQESRSIDSPTKIHRK